MQRFSHFFQCSKVCRSAFEESRELFKAMWWLLIPVQECFSCRVARYSTAQDHEHALQHAAEERAHSLGLMCLCFYDTMRNFWISLPVRRSSIVGPNMTLLSWQTALISATTLAVWRLEISGSLERFEWALRPDTLLGALKDKMEGDLKASCKWCAPSESPFVIGLSALRFCSVFSAQVISNFVCRCSLQIAQEVREQLSWCGAPGMCRNRHGRAMVPDLSCSSRLRWVPRQSTKIESMQFQNGLSLQPWAQTSNNKAMIAILSSLHAAAHFVTTWVAECQRMAHEEKFHTTSWTLWYEEHGIQSLGICVPWN